MKTDTAESFINEIDVERFKKNRDYLMKLVEEDYKLIAWISWGLDLLFRDYTYEQMKDFIGQADVEELKKSIIPVDVKINTEDIKGVLFDKYFELRKDGKTICLLDIENQINLYPIQEIQARGVVYICSMVYWESEYIIENKENYRQTKPVYGLWIFPEAPEKRKNEILDLPIVLPNKALKYQLKADGSSMESESEKPDFKLDNVLYQYFLGNPLDIGSNILKETGRKDKLTCLLLLLDILFGFDLDKDKRLELIGELFNLKGRITDGEVEIMNAVENLIAVGEARGIEIGEARGIEIGEARGIKKGKKEGKAEGLTEGKENERKENIRLLSSYLISQSGNTLSTEEADKKAEEILTKPGEFQN